VFSCRQEVNYEGVCLNGTHPCLLTVFKPFLIVNVKLAVWIVYGQWTQSTKPPELSVDSNSAEIGRLRKPAGLISEVSSIRCGDQNASRYG
jgi:hypothetical protein